MNQIYWEENLKNAKISLFELKVIAFYHYNY